MWGKAEGRKTSGGKREAASTPLLRRRTFLPLPDPIREVLVAFRPRFPAPTGRTWMIVWTGTRLAHGRRTVAVALRHSGHKRETSVRPFPHVLHRARWSPWAVSRHVLFPIVGIFGQAGGTGERLIDETRQRRWGPTISTRGHDRDRALSSRSGSCVVPGLFGIPEFPLREEKEVISCFIQKKQGNARNDAHLRYHIRSENTTTSARLSQRCGIIVSSL